MIYFVITIHDDKLNAAVYNAKARNGKLKEIIDSENLNIPLVSNLNIIINRSSRYGMPFAASITSQILTSTALILKLEEGRGQCE
jgi:hypothetical protein